MHGDKNDTYSTAITSFVLFAPSVDTVDAALKMDPADFKNKYGITKPPLDAPHLVFYCQMGRRGATARDKARQLGYVR